MKNSESDKKLDIPKLTWTIFTLRTLNSLSWSSTMPFLAVYLEVERGVPLSVIGITYLVSGLLTLISEVLGGRLTDSIGPKKVMLMGYASSVLSALFLGALIQFRAPVISILVLYPVFNLFRSVTQPATSALIANQDAKHIRIGFAFLNIGGNLGFAIGPAVGGFLTQDYSYATVFLFSAAAASVVGGITYFRIGSGLLSRKDAPGVVPKRLRFKEDRSLIFFLFLTLCSLIALGYEITPMSLYVAGFLSFSNLEIGYLFAINGLIIVILQLPLTKLIERSKYMMAPLVISTLFVALAYFVASASSDFMEFVLVMLFVTIGEIFQSVPAQTVVALFSRAGNRGTYQGYYFGFTTFGRSFASFVGPLSFGLLAFSPGLSWIFIGSFSLLTGLGYYLISSRLEKDYEIKRREDTTKFEPNR